MPVAMRSSGIKMGAGNHQGIVIIVLVTISLQFPYLHTKNKDGVSVGEMVRLCKGVVSIPKQTTKK